MASPSRLLDVIAVRPPFHGLWSSTNGSFFLCLSSSDTSDLHFKASKDRYGGQPLFFEKFPSLWSGARSTHGVTKGKICFEAKVREG